MLKERNPSVITQYCIFLEKLENVTVEEIRREAWQKLRETDWTQIPDEPLTTEQRREWREYRVYLGNIEELWKNKQILKLEVMDFEEWKENKPIFKVEKRRWYIE